MWKIFKAEIKYNSNKILTFATAIPLLIFVESAIESFPKIYIVLLLLFSIQTWFLNRNKEQRDRQLALLPVSYTQIASIRILVIFFLSLIIAVIYFGIYKLIYSTIQLDYGAIILAAEVVLILYTISFIIRDLTFQFFRKLGFNKNKIKLILIIFILALNFLVIYAFLYTKSQGQAPKYIESTLHYIETNNPFIHSNALLHFTVLLAVFAVLSVISFVRKSAYLE